MTSSRIVWTLGELAEVLRKRQLNKFDVNIGVSGKRGNGKSTFINKLLLRYKNDGFNQKKQQVYSREDVTKLLGTQKFSYCWDDEAINSGYKRDFQNAGQKELIKIVTNYRDNYNMYISALPFFYSLDKDLRELIFLHVHIIERGIGVLLMPIKDNIHTADPWDSKTNEKIEQKEQEKILKNPDHKFRYEKLTTFAGYIYFNDLTEKQQEFYKEIKEEKRERRFKMLEEQAQENKELTFNEKVYKLIKEKKLTPEGLKSICLMENKDEDNVLKSVTLRLKKEGIDMNAKKFMESYVMSETLEEEYKREQLRKMRKLML